MEKAKDYFDKEYDGNHIATVVDMFDLESLYGLMEEYAEAQVKKTSTKNVIVIHEKDLSDNEEAVIGVADSLEDADRMIKEYYGNDLIREVSYTDIRDSSLEYTKVFELRDRGSETYKTQVTTEWFRINEI